MTTYTPEQLRELASALPGTCADIVRAHADALEELARLRSRLEIDFVTDGNGKRVPFPEGGPDGIACRDETIRLLEAALAYVRKTLDEVRPGMDTGAPIEAIVREVVAALAESERKCERLIDVALHKFGVDLSAEFKEDKP